MKDVTESFATLMELFDEAGIAKPAQAREFAGEITFSVNGPRGSIILYRLWGGDVVDAWFGKVDSDSGGLALASPINAERQLHDLLKLHKRFMGSGRLKVLRNYSRQR